MTRPTLAGTRVLLRPPRPGDELDRQQHGWHAAIEWNFGQECEDRPMTDDEAAAWLASQQTAANDPDRRHWVIAVDGAVVGVAFLHSIDEADRKARFAIGMFSPQFIGKGLGSEATRLVLSYAFTDMGLHRVDLHVLEFNAAARRSYERCGFAVEGRERESCWLAGRWYDDLVMGILAHEFPGLNRPT